MSGLLRSFRPHIFFVILFFMTVVLIAAVVEKLQGPHGGMIKKSDGCYIEMRTEEKKLFAYLLDRKMKTFPNKDIIGEVRFLLLDNTTTTVPLVNEGDDGFTCGIPADFATCKITLKTGSREFSAKFSNALKVVKQ